MAAATPARLRLTVMVINANCYPAVDSPRQHTARNHLAHLHPAVSKMFATGSGAKLAPRKRVRPVARACVCLWGGGAVFVN